MTHPRFDKWRIRILDSFPERFWKRLNPGKPDECWEWPGALITDGYGQVSLHCEMLLTHRVAWELTNGPIPIGIKVLHKCDNPPCSNPAHLFLGTDSDNTRDCIAKGRYFYLRGSTNGNSKLTEEKVLKIREFASTHSHGQLAKMFHVDVSNIDLIVERRTWKHI